MKVTTTIYKDKSFKQAHDPQHEVEISEDLKKARIINPWNGAWGMAKRSRFNNLNTVVNVLAGEDSYTVYVLSAMGQKVYFKLSKKELGQLK